MPHPVSPSTLKARGFVLDKKTHRPLAGVAVCATAEMADGPSLLLGMLMSDGAGYVSFDLSHARALVGASLKHLWIAVVGVDANRVDLLAAAATIGAPMTTHVPERPPLELFPFVLYAEAVRERSCGANQLPSVQTPDLRDWELSPYSFTVRREIVLGEGCCETPARSNVPEREFGFVRVVRVSTADDRGTKTATPLAPIDVSRRPAAADGRGAIRFGAALEFRQRWYGYGHSLGEIVYSLPLAPCESVNLAVIDWSRQDVATRTDTVVSGELLLHEQRRDRSIEETLWSALRESQGGWSVLGGVGAAAGAVIPVEGVPIFAGLAAAGGSGMSSSWGSREVNADDVQQLHDMVTQATSVVRTLNSTVVVQATQAESNLVQTRTVANHNHCHALTIQYYEVLRNFRIVTEFVRRRPVVLIPYKVIAFTWREALRFRTALSRTLIDARLASCFDALVRLNVSPSSYEPPAEDKPAGGNGGSGGGTTTPPAKAKTIAWYELHLKTTTWNSSLTWGEIWVEVGRADGSWVELYHKAAKDDGGPELVQGEQTTTIQAGGALALDPAQLTRVRVRWRESNISDSWDFKAITIRYGIAGETTVATLIDEEGKVPPAYTKSKLPALKYFDDSGPKTAQEWIGLAPAQSTGPAVPVPQTSPSTSPAPTVSGGNLPKKQDDEYCQALLLEHLNANAGYYNRAIWLLQDDVDRQLLLEAALAAHPDILGGLNPAPLTASGNYVAFAYEPKPGSDADAGAFTAPEPAVSLVSLPTRGLLAEAQLGHCNSCETRDVTRFWKWEESPCPPAPTIEDIRPGPRGETPAVQPASLPSPVVQVMQAPSAPDPVGLAAAFNLLGQPNVFRDMSGMQELSSLLNGLSSGAIDLAKAQMMAGDVKNRLASGGRPSPAGAVPTADQTPENRYDNLQVARHVAESAGELGWDEEKTDDVTGDIVGGGGGFWSNVRRMTEQGVLGAAPKGGGLAAVGAAVGEKALDLVSGEAKKLIEGGKLRIEGPKGAAVILSGTDPSSYSPPSSYAENMHYVQILLDNIGQAGPGDGLSALIEVEWLDDCHYETTAKGPMAQYLRSIAFKKNIYAKVTATLGGALEEAQVTINVVPMGVDAKVGGAKAMTSLSIDVSVAPKTAIGSPLVGSMLVPLDPAATVDYKISDSTSGFKRFVMEAVPRP